MPMQIDGKEVSGMWVAASEGVPADGLTHQLHLNGPEYGVDYTAPTGTFSNANPGVYDTDYHYDGLASMQYLASRGWGVVKLPIRWERIQPVLNAPLDAGELGRLSTFVGHCQAAGLKINLDIHNYGLYYRNVSGTGTRTIIGSTAVPISAFADLWRRLATAFADSETVTIYNLCAEPQGDYGGLTAAVWHEASQAAVSAIREVDTVTEIHVAGFGWSSLRWWVSHNGSGGWITDPHDNFRYVAHHYWDSDGGGSYDTTYAANLATAMSENHTRPGAHDALHARVLNDLDAWNSWLSSVGARGMVGELGWPYITDVSSWGRLAEAYYVRLSELGIPAALWSAGEWADWAELSAYEGSPISGVRSSGLLVEGHLGAPAPEMFYAVQSAHVWDGGWRQVWSAFTLQPDVIMTWSVAGSHTLTLPAYECEVDVLVVGGGGGGRGGASAASGGLGDIKVSTITHDGGVSVPVVIGTGGAGGSRPANGASGGASSILGVSAAGGAGGAQSGGAAEKRHPTGHVAHGVSHNLYPYGWGGAGVTYGNGAAGGAGYVWVRIRDMRTGPTPPSGVRYVWSGSSGRVPESGNLPAGLTPLITHTVTAPGTTTASVTVTFDYEWPDVEATIELTKNGVVIGTRVPDLTLGPTQSLTVTDVTVATGDIIELRINSDTQWGAWYPVLSSSLTLA